MPVEVCVPHYMRIYEIYVTLRSQIMMVGDGRRSDVHFWLFHRAWLRNESRQLERGSGMECDDLLHSTYNTMLKVR